MSLNEAKIADNQLTVDGIASLLQPFCDKYLNGRSMYSRGWEEGARNRFHDRLKQVFGPEWKIDHDYYGPSYILTKEGWEIKITLRTVEVGTGSKWGGYYQGANGKKEPPRANFKVEVYISESPALKKDREDRAAKKVADREDVIKNYQPDQKDIQRVNSILDKFPDNWQAMKHLRSMADTIKSKSKAYRRGVAAYQRMKEFPRFKESECNDVLDYYMRVANNAVNESRTFHGPYKKTIFESLREV